MGVWMDAAFLHTNSAVHGDMGIVKDGDMVVMQIAKKRGRQLEDFKRNHPGEHIGQILSDDRKR